MVCTKDMALRLRFARDVGTDLGRSARFKRREDIYSFVELQSRVHPADIYISSWTGLAGRPGDVSVRRPHFLLVDQCPNLSRTIRRRRSVIPITPRLCCDISRGTRLVSRTAEVRAWFEMSKPVRAIFLFVRGTSSAAVPMVRVCPSLPLVLLNHEYRRNVIELRLHQIRARKVGSGKK